MSINQGNKISTKGLVFAFDAGVDKRIANKSFRGRPTTNWLWNYHARIDNSYSSYTNTSSGTWPAKHNDAITVYSVGGNNISNYVNTGVTDYTNTYHAHWVLDPELGRPVVIMRNFDGGQWKAKWMSTGKTKAQMGLAVGDKYTISYLQWTDNISRGCNVGLYSSNGTSNNFWDGTTTIKNTKVATWQRVSHTYTVSNNGTAYNASVYMYGHYGGRGVLKIADVQIEKGGPSPFIAGTSEATSTRSSTTSLLDWTGNHTINLASMNYPDDGTFRFTSNSHNITVDSNGFYISGPKTLSIWIRSDRPLSTTDNWEVGFLNQGSTQGSMFGFMYGVGNCQDLGFWGYGSSYDMSVESTTNRWSSDGNWHNGVITMDSSRNVRVYIDGEAKQWLKHSDYSTKVDYVTMPIDTTNYFLINSRAAWNSGMSYVDLGNVMVYNRPLSAEEVLNNYNAHKDRFV